MINKKPTVTVALSALNEERNIKAFLNSILSQIDKKFILRNIWVYSDGSTDKTVEIVRSIKSKKIEVKVFKNRMGKTYRLNQIYSSLKTDILVQSDADVVFANPLVIENIIQPFINDKEVGMVCGHSQPLPGITFTEKAVNCSWEVNSKLRKFVRKGNNMFSVDGRILGYRKKFIKTVKIPPETIGNDRYSYYFCINKGYKIIYVPSAIALYRSPKNLKDQIKQNTRFFAIPIAMKRYFPPELINKEERIPSFFKRKLMIMQFLKHPIMCAYIFIINKYCYLKANSAVNYLTAKWPVANSTKQL